MQTGSKIMFYTKSGLSRDVRLMKNGLNKAGGINITLREQILPTTIFSSLQN